MRKFALATAAVAALALSAPAFIAPAFAQDVKVKIGDRHHGDHDRMRHRNVSKTVIIKHRDHGRHEGWRHEGWRRHHDHHGGKTVIIKKRGEG
jgi:hypothetical protein